MPDWSNPLEIVNDAEIFQKFCLVMLGLSTWEIITQLPFDWSIISRKRDARWPLFFYFYCKYSLWLAVIGVNIALNVTTKVHCQSLYVFNQFAGNTAIGSASTLLMLRTIAVWNRAPLLTGLLVVTSLGQWGILFHGIAMVRSSWSDATNACVVDEVPPVFVELIYLYTMSFDLIVLLLTTIGLVRSPGQSSLWQLLFRQGVVYFLVAFVANTLPTTFLLLNLNPIMNIMFTIPAAVASSIVACRSFVSLVNFQGKDVYVHAASPYSATRIGSSGRTISGDVIQARRGGGGASDGSPRKKKGSNGNTIAGIAFRGMGIGAGVDAMGQAYSLDELDTTRTITTLAHVDSKRAYDFGDSIEGANGIGSENGQLQQQVVVHMGTMVYGDGNKNENPDVDCDVVNVVDLEKAETSSHGHGHGRYDGQKSFVPDV